MPLAVRSSRESRSERCKRAFLLAPICKVLLAPTLVSDRARIIRVPRRDSRDPLTRTPESGEIPFLLFGFSLSRFGRFGLRAFLDPTPFRPSPLPDRAGRADERLASHEHRRGRGAWVTT